MVEPGFLRKISKSVQKKGGTYWYYKVFKSGNTFCFAGNSYEYFYHCYNRTWMNERSVEVPIILEYVKRYRGLRILEVGNVLSHYFSTDHDVVDKYEKADGVINKDIVDFQSLHSYDLIVSISTLEHVGWDERPPNQRKIATSSENPSDKIQGQKQPENCGPDERRYGPHKISVVVESLRRLLNPAGCLVFSVPLGHNPHLDELLKKGSLGLQEQRYLKRISRDNRWEEVDWSSVEGVAYNRPFFYANALIIGLLESSGS